MPFVHWRRPEAGAWAVVVGGLAGLALAIKVPALAVVVSLALTLFVWRRWKPLGIYGLTVSGTYLVLNGPFLLTSGSLFIKQVFFYQFLRPVNRLAVTGEFTTNSDLTAFGYISSSPGLVLTILGAGLGLAALILRWLARRDGAEWLPVVLTVITTSWLYTGKAGFFPHYYAHMAMPLALLAGSVVNFWWAGLRQSRSRLVLAGVGILAIGFVTGPVALHVEDAPSKPSWSWERAAARALRDKDGVPNNTQATVATLDPRFSMVLGTRLPTDSYNRYLADNAGYTEYLSLGLEKQSLGQLAYNTLFDNKVTRQDLRQARYSPLIQNNLLATFQKSQFVLIEDWA